MANTQQTNLVASAYRCLPILMPGFLPRDQQKSMISRSLSLMTRNMVGLVEAPTGTGKSLGYLIPGIATAVTEDKVLIISTATVALQDQLASKDIPVVLRAFLMAGVVGVNVVVAKGRERHVCPMKLHAIHQSTGVLFEDSNEASEQKELHKIADEWNNGGWDGTRDTLPVSLHQNQWKKIANTASSCTGKQQCPLVDECPYYKMQADMKKARVIITNHDYLLSNLSNVPNSIFSKESNIFVFDEAHHLNEKLLDAFAKKLDLSDFWLNEIRNVTKLQSNTAMAIQIAADRVINTWNLCQDAATTILGDGLRHRFAYGEVSPHFKGYLTELKGLLIGLNDALNAEKEASPQKRSKNNPLALLMEGRFNELIKSVVDAIACIDDFIGDDDIARWIEKNRYGVELRCSPFDGASKARKHLWPIVKNGLLTSATFTTIGSFESQKTALGLSSDTVTLKLESPFDHNRARLVVPRFAVEATDPKHPQRVIAFLKDDVFKSENKGVLVHFTSKKLMRQCYEALSQQERQDVLMQGEWQAWAMVKEHKDRIDAGRRSILFGLDSIGEGVDLPGHYCTLVVVTRLPFPSPDDPVLATHAEHLKDAGHDPFHILTLPKMTLKLAQIFGRLMRREDDFGEVMVLDRRLSSKRYGKQIVEGSFFRHLKVG